MIGSVDQEQPDITRPLYSFAETDRLAEVPPNTSKRWLKGYHFWYSPTERRTMPPITPAPTPKDAASFIDLLEVATIGRLKKKGFSYQRIRKIDEYCKLYLQTPRPLVTETFKVHGREIFVEASQGVLLNVGYEAGLLAWEEVLDPFLDDVEYENELVRRWWPRTKEVGVVIDPDYGFGLPVIEGTGIRTEIIAERNRAGDSIEEITYDFSVNAEQIEDALRYEEAA